MFHSSIGAENAPENAIPGKKSPWVLLEAPKQLVGNLFQFSVQRLLKMSPVVMIHLRVETLPQSCATRSVLRGASVKGRGYLAPDIYVV